MTATPGFSTAVYSFIYDKYIVFYLVTCIALVMAVANQ